MRNKSPYREHRMLYNLILVYAYSLDSGPDQCACPLVNDTAFGLWYTGECGGGGIGCSEWRHDSSVPDCGQPSMQNIVEAELRPPFQDTTLFMVNLQGHGCAGIGERASYGINPATGIHELGHSFGLLSDEYVTYPQCGTSASEINTSMNATVGAWPEWISDLGPPHEGAEYYSECVYKSTSSCAMATITPSFCPVCRQQLTLRIWGNSHVNSAAPVEELVPPASPGVPLDVPVTFRPKLRLPSGTGVNNDLVWTMIGPGYPNVVVAQGVESYTHTFTQPGEYKLDLDIVAASNIVKPEKQADNADSASWIITTCSDPPDPSLPDGDSDGIGEPCDNCPDNPDPDQTDSDLDLQGDICDPCPLDPENDRDADGLCGDVDNCIHVPNPDQADQDSDGLGDICDSCQLDPYNDIDSDGHCADVDNCPWVMNSQFDYDHDGMGDECDPCPQDGENDEDNDGHCSNEDNCPQAANPGQEDLDHTAGSQWAATATASSEWTATDYSAMQATGAPEFPGLCGDRPTAWSPATDTLDPEWIELVYPSAALVRGVVVHEAYEGGFVDQIDIRDTEGALHTVWFGSDPTACGGAFSPEIDRTYHLADSVIVRTSRVAWEEIDAVEMLSWLPLPDGIGNACDNCPTISNSYQVDSDSDGAGDECDCAPADPAVRPPGDTHGLLVDKITPTVSRVSWPALTGADQYAVTRGLLSTLAWLEFGDCLSAEVTDGWIDDGDLPPDGDGYTYLLQGASGACGMGTLGFGPGGWERINENSAACDMP
jgi:hypothetical protein